MIGLLAALLLQSPGDRPIPFAPEFGREPFIARIRAGAWFSDGFRFDAVRTDFVHVANREDLLPAGGLDLGVTLWEGVFAFASAEGAFGSHTQIKAGGLSLGYRELATADTPEGLPDEASVYAGAFYGTFDVDAFGFGDFDGAFGFRGGISASWKLAPGIGAGVVLEYRHVEFKYRPAVLTGDRYAAGAGVWFGFSMDFRF
jgi:hypothetical protein